MSATRLFHLVGCLLLIGLYVGGLMVAVEGVETENAQVKAGYEHLEAGRLKEARQAFEDALKREETAVAQTGLGQVLAAMGKSHVQRAFQAFRKALALDPNFFEAQMQIALLHAKLGNEDAVRELRRCIKMKPDDPRAYRELIARYETGRLDYEEDILDLCDQYIEQFPDDPMGYYHLALVHAERFEYAEVLEIAKGARTMFPDDMRWFALEGQAHAARGNPRRALGLFNLYLKMIDDTERGYYTDLSLVASEAELAAFEALPEADRPAFLEQFWATRKGALMLGGDARLAEHYRRVWYARTFFGHHVQPWDKRGEVYIRYGEPDYRSRSGRANPMPALAVQHFKERKATELVEQRATYRGQEPQRTLLPMMAPGNTYYPGGQYDGQDFPTTEEGGRLIPAEVAQDMDSYERTQAVREGQLFEVDPTAFSSGWLWEVMDPSGSVRLNFPPGMMMGIEPAVPIERGTDGSISAPWESWVYLGIGKGKEFVFTDDYMSGRWDFPSTPKNLWHTELLTAVNNAQPAVELMQTVSETPEYFDVPPGVELLDFYYDLATFRGENGYSLLEVYFGIPPEQVTIVREEDRVQLEIERSFVLTNGDLTYRTTNDLVFRDDLPEPELSGLFVELAALNVPPGEYTLGVKLADRVSGKWGVYRQEIEIPEFGEALSLSELEMAWAVTDTPKADKFKKGDVWVVPAPTRSYLPDRDAHLYYEVYNLKRDEFGQARYKVAYTIRPEVKQGSGLVGVVLGGMRHLFAAKEPEFTVGYERVTGESDEPVFFALETAKLTPGLKQVVVTITDLNSQETASRQAVFRVVEPPKPKDVYDDVFEQVMKALESGEEK